MADHLMHKIDIIDQQEEALIAWFVTPDTEGVEGVVE